MRGWVAVMVMVMTTGCASKSGAPPAALSITPRVEVVGADLTVKYRHVPRFGGSEVVRCRVVVKIDIKGRPEEAMATECDEVVEKVSVDAAMRSRWEPYEVDGVPTPVQTKVVYAFK